MRITIKAVKYGTPKKFAHQYDKNTEIKVFDINVPFEGKLAMEQHQLLNQFILCHEGTMNWVNSPEPTTANNWRQIEAVIMACFGATVPVKKALTEVEEWVMGYAIAKNYR